MNFYSLKPGDEICLRPYPCVPGAVLQPGRVIYIHPQKRFFTVDFTTASGEKFRESYIPYGDHTNCFDEREFPGQSIAKIA